MSHTTRHLLLQDIDSIRESMGRRYGDFFCRHRHDHSDSLFPSSQTCSQMPGSSIDVYDQVEPGGALHGIQHSNGGRFCTIRGGLPILWGEFCLGGIGVSGGTPDQDKVRRAFSSSDPVPSSKETLISSSRRSPKPASKPSSKPWSQIVPKQNFDILRCPICFLLSNSPHPSSLAASTLLESLHLLYVVSISTFQSIPQSPFYPSPPQQSFAYI